MRAPDPLDEARLVRDRNATRGRAEDQRETPPGIGRVFPDARARRSGRSDVHAEPGKAIVAERANPNVREKLGWPAFFVRQIAKLGGDGAERALKRACRA